MSEPHGPPEEKSLSLQRRFGRIEDAMRPLANEPAWGLLLALDTVYHRGDKDRKNIQSITTKLLKEFTANRQPLRSKTTILLTIQERAKTVARSSILHDHAQLKEFKASIEPDGPKRKIFVQSIRDQVTVLLEEMTRQYQGTTAKLLNLIQEAAKALYLESLDDLMLNALAIGFLILMTITTFTVLVERQNWINATDRVSRNGALAQHELHQSIFYSRLSPEGQILFLRRNTHLPQWERLHFP